MVDIHYIFVDAKSAHLNTPCSHLSHIGLLVESSALMSDEEVD